MVQDELAASSPFDTEHPVALLFAEPLELNGCLLQLLNTAAVLLLQHTHLLHKHPRTHTHTHTQTDRKT